KYTHISSLLKEQVSPRPPDSPGTPRKWPVLELVDSWSRVSSLAEDCDRSGTATSVDALLVRKMNPIPCSDP
ncbi:hypothetical protein TNCV_4424781, partial [Trichonephila clavipes]